MACPRQRSAPVSEPPRWRSRRPALTGSTPPPRSSERRGDQSMSYQIVVSGHAASKKAEAEVLEKAIAFAEGTSSEGGFAFSGTYFQIHTGPTGQATATAREALDAYNAE